MFWWVVEQRAYPTLRAVTVPKRGVMETIAPEHGFWNSQTPVTGVPGDDLVSVRFLEQIFTEMRWCPRAPVLSKLVEVGVTESHTCAGKDAPSTGFTVLSNLCYWQNLKSLTQPKKIRLLKDDRHP